jgi:hypothetical protein
MLTEAMLIEITERFGQLEELIDEADVFLAEQVERATEAIAKAGLDYKKHNHYGRFCRETGEHEETQTEINHVRDDIQMALKLCRVDLAAMLTQIRRSDGIANGAG